MISLIEKSYGFSEIRVLFSIFLCINEVIRVLVAFLTKYELALFNTKAIFIYKVYFANCCTYSLNLVINKKEYF